MTTAKCGLYKFAGKNEIKILKTQIEHRLKIINFWNISKGTRILEIGCGQGETTLPNPRDEYEKPYPNVVL
jgi:cyclopropane fatty-acyl-phospholipid synthase-like methyltransferase